jgi:hypothetical protein
VTPVALKRVKNAVKACAATVLEGKPNPNTVADHVYVCAIQRLNLQPRTNARFTTPRATKSERDQTRAVRNWSTAAVAAYRRRVGW